MVKVCVGATISGVVVNAITSQPIANAAVSGGGKSTTSNAQGEYRLTDVQVGTDNVPKATSVAVNAAGFYSETQSVTVFCNEDPTIPATFTRDFGSSTTKYGTITGIVTNTATGLPIANAFVGGNFGGATTTDAAGKYKLDKVQLNPDLSSRTWEVTVRPDGFDELKKSVTVSADTVSTLDFGFTPVRLGVTLTNDANRDGVFAPSESLARSTLVPRVATFKVQVTNPSTSPTKLYGLADALSPTLAVGANTTAPTGGTGCNAVLGGTIAAGATLDCYYDVNLSSTSANVSRTLATTGSGASSSSATSTITFVDAPIITSVDPASGPRAGGTVVTITGTNLAGITSATFGGDRSDGDHPGVGHQRPTHLTGTRCRNRRHHRHHTRRYEHGERRNEVHVPGRYPCSGDQLDQPE